MVEGWKTAKDEGGRKLKTRITFCLTLALVYKWISVQNNSFLLQFCFTKLAAFKKLIEQNYKERHILFSKTLGQIDL